MAHEFKVGDRVKVRETFPNPDFAGKVGVVRDARPGTGNAHAIYYVVKVVGVENFYGYGEDGVGAFFVWDLEEAPAQDPGPDRNVEFGVGEPVILTSGVFKGATGVVREVQGPFRWVEWHRRNGPAWVLAEDLAVPFRLGARVQVRSGKHAGRIGTVTSKGRLLCYVRLDGGGRNLAYGLSELREAPAEPVLPEGTIVRILRGGYEGEAIHGLLPGTLAEVVQAEDTPKASYVVRGSSAANPDGVEQSGLLLGVDFEVVAAASAREDR